MSVYLPENITRAEMEKKRRDNVCKVCGEFVSIFYDIDREQWFLACHGYMTNNHEGIEKEASELKMKGMLAMNMPAREERMVEQFGKSKALALRKYQGIISLTRTQATEIMEAIWPGAPEAEKTRAIMLCVSYQLNPLMKHIFLIPFNKKRDGKIIGTEWVTVMGIGATRLLASRKGVFSYIDDTPRIMTPEEQVKRFGKSYPDRLYVIVKVKDPKSGAEAPGYGWWPASQPAYGEDKGNSQFNMAANRAERQALSRLRPGEMPSDVEVMDESMAEVASFQGVDEDIVEVEGEIIDEKLAVANNDKPAPLPAATTAGVTPSTKVKRDPDTIRNFGELYVACREDFGLKTRQEVWKEYGVKSQEEISDKPADVYRKIASVRA